MAGTMHRFDKMSVETMHLQSKATKFGVEVKALLKLDDGAVGGGSCCQ